MKLLTLISTLCLVFTISAKSQSSKPYITAGGEMIFSFAGIDNNGTDGSSLLRWTPFFNIQTMVNSDLSDKFGIFSGLAIRNVGYIYDGYTDPATQVIYKKKFRSYNLGIPIGFKIGNLDNMFLFGGYEVEFPFLYKEKTFDGTDKINKTTGWFSKRQELFQHGFLVGIQFPRGPSIKFKYYLSEFHNQDFQDSAGTKPYAGLESNIFYFSLSYYLFSEFASY